MLTTHPAIRAGFRVGGRISPRTTIRAAYAGFTRLGPPRPVRPSHEHVHRRAETAELRLSRGPVVTYTWPGGSAGTILVVHGWRSRASRFSPLIDDLTRAGHTVVSFDAPASGDSPGKHATILDYLEAIHILGRQHGPFTAVVGHSLGALSAAVAINEGLPAERLVTVAAIARFDYMIEAYTEAIALPTRLRERFRGHIARHLFPDELDPFHRFKATTGETLTTIPLLLIHDHDDHWSRSSESRLLAASHPSPELVMTSGLGHNRDLTSDDVRTTISRFIADAEPAKIGDHQDQHPVNP